MENINPYPEKINSFNKDCYNSVPSPTTPHSAKFTESSTSDPHSRQSSLVTENLDDHGEFSFSSSSSSCVHSIEQVSQDIDRFTDALAAVANDKSADPPQVPDTVETFSKIIDSRIAKYKSGESRKDFGKMTQEDSFFFEAVMRISKLTNAISVLPSNSATSHSLNRTSVVLQRAMVFMEEELRALLEDSIVCDSNSNFRITKNSSFKTKNEESDRCILQPELTSTAQKDDHPSYSPEIITKMSRIVSAMISSGYETECCQVYSIARRNAFHEQLKRLECEKINMEDIWRMNWESLEGEISRWINIVRNCSKILFPSEKRLCELVFANHPLISRSIFSNLARTVVIQLLDFAEAVSMTRRAAEKLFKFLDMHETLRELIPVITNPCSDNCEHEISSEISASTERIGEAAVTIFTDLENSIKSDVAKAPVPGGAVHPLTRYVMNYLEYACEYKETLEQIFEQHAKLDHSSPITGANSILENENDNPDNFETAERTTPFSIQLVTVMDLLYANLEAKSKLYRDPSLRYVFLMNNGRYILQKVKASTEIRQVMGDTWCKKRSTVVRQFHKNYQRETWIRLLHTLSHEGLQVNGKVNKTLLKDRFKSFNAMFDDIHKTQASWVVSDEQLQSELRVSISAVVIPAYRSFIGRFRQYLDSQKQAEKYIKYQPEDIETLIEELFDGNHMSMGRRRN